MLERRDQPVVVALVQPDRRLVEHVHHPGEARADLRGEPDALRLAARQRLGGPIERQVVESDVDQEAQPVEDLAHDALADHLPGAWQRERVEPFERLAQREPRQFVDRPVGAARPDAHEARVDAQSHSIAGRAGARVQVLRQFLAHVRRVGFPVATLQVGDHALERVLAHRRAAAVGCVGERNLLAARAVQHHVANAFGQFLERRVDVEAVERGQVLQQLEVELVAAVPPLDRARGEAQVGERHDAFRVEELHHAEPVALRAGADRVVEREQPRFELGQRMAAHRAGELAGEQLLVAAVDAERDRAAVGDTQRGFERLGQSLADRRRDLDPVDDHVDRVLLVAVQLRRIVGAEFDDARLRSLAAHPHPHEPLRLQVGEQLEVLALAVGQHRREDHQPRALAHREHRVDHLRHGLRLERVLGMGRAVRRADPREQQPQVVVDLGDRADRRARVVAGGLLLDRDRRRQAFDQVDVGLFHQLQELPRVGRQRLDVATLALRVQRVEGERGLARSGQAGDHHQPVARHVEADVLQVVGARTPDADRFHAFEDQSANIPGCECTRDAPPVPRLSGRRRPGSRPARVAAGA